MTEISVVIPTCDRPRLLVTALQSVLAQTVQPTEIVVVDNGVTPVVPGQLPCKVTLERLPARVGVSRARNAGVEKARSTYVAFLDDDDTWAPDYLEHMAAAIADAPTPPDLLVGRMDTIRDGKQQVRKCVTSVQTLMPRLLCSNPGVVGSNIVVRRQTFHEIGGFDETLISSTDRALALDFLEAGAQIVCVPRAVIIQNTTHDGPRLTDTALQIVGKRRIIAEYRRLMGVDEWLNAHAQILALRARNNGLYWPLIKGLRVLRLLVRRLPERYRKMLTRCIRAGAPDVSS